MGIILNPTYRYLLKLIQGFSWNKKISVLDYGCGSGYILEVIPNKTIKLYRGYDINHQSILYAKKRWWNNKSIKFFHILNRQQPFVGSPKSYDLILFIGVLQYMTWNEIDEILFVSRKLLKKDGRIIISCIIDHKLYQMMDLYRLFIPQRYINRKRLVSLFGKNKLIIEDIKEKGIFFSPLFSHVLVIPFDFLDKILFRTKGTLGPIGRGIRYLASYVLYFEYLIRIDFGYTLYVTLKK